MLGARARGDRHATGSNVRDQRRFARPERPRRAVARQDRRRRGGLHCSWGGRGVRRRGRSWARGSAGERWCTTRRAGRANIHDPRGSARPDCAKAARWRPAASSKYSPVTGVRDGWRRQP
eukprot:4374097-Prymnesium_polylepis.2